jgi:hypothetical protein
LGDGVAQATIDNAEKALGTPLPESYKWWLLKYGGGQIKGDVVYGLDEGAMGRPDIVELAQMNERDGLYGKDRLVVCMGNTENFYFDTEHLDGGEYEVFLHELAGDEGMPYATTFAGFLERRIREVYGL